jgi:hypothetical protein
MPVQAADRATWRVFGVHMAGALVGVARAIVTKHLLVRPKSSPIDGRGSDHRPQRCQLEHGGHMAYTRDSVPDLTGRTAVVTGANGDLGL